MEQLQRKQSLEAVFEKLRSVQCYLKIIILLLLKMTIRIRRPNTVKHILHNLSINGGQ